jgi:VanZ family protein
MYRAVSRTHKFLRYWLPVLIWMALIFSASADSQSSQRSSRFIGPLVRWFIPNISEARLYQIVFIARKAAHVTEYAVLSCLFARALHTPAAFTRPEWSRKRAALAWFVAALYSATDELHQAFVPNRDGRWTDVGIDAIGALVGVLVFWSWGRLRKFW